MTEIQKCSTCGCKKLLKFFKVRENTGKIYKTCISCSERFKCRFKCDKCEYKCSFNCYLQQHIKQVHDKIKNFECDLCEYKCSTNSDLQRHIKICKGKDSSNMSGLEFKTKEALETLGFIRDEDYIFNQSYSKLTDYCGKCLRPDFRFIRHKIIIECDGSQHYKVKEFGSSKEKAEEQFIKTQENDQIKNDFCRIYGYKMIRIKYDQIMNMLEILHSELDDIITY
jgi:hypothetical protein